MFLHTRLCPLFVLTLLLGVYYPALGQLKENFTDDNILPLARWGGDTHLYEVINGQLQTKGQDTESSFIYCPSLQSHGIWEFELEMDFNPSSTSFAKAYLLSDHNNFNGDLHAYYVLIGNTSDEIGLYRQDGKQSTKLLSLAGITDKNTIDISIVVQRFSDGLWRLYYKHHSEASFHLIGETVDSTYHHTLCFGFFCQYTPSRTQSIRFDNIYVAQDSLAPTIDSVHLLNPNTLTLHFNEIVKETENNHYALPNATIQTLSHEANVVTLTLASPLVSENSYELSIQNIQDNFGNILKDTTVVFHYVENKAYDVLITEVMFAPNNLTLLPAVEYIEIYNATDSPISLQHWVLTDNHKSYLLPDSVLLAKEYAIILRAEDQSLFSTYGKRIPTTTLSLNNSGERLTLYDNKGKQIHSLAYSDDLYNDPTRDDGGFAIEMIDLNNPCEGRNNWHASLNNMGGTPCKKNSVYGVKPDTTKPTIENIFPITHDTVQLWFSESLDSSALVNVSNYWLDELGTPATTEVVLPAYESVKLGFSTELRTEKTYQMTVNMMDCQQNYNYEEVTLTFPVALSSSSSILLNELLFDPIAEGVDFIEIVNTDTQVYNLKDIYFAQSDATGALLPNTIQTIAQDRLLFPHEHYVLTSDKSKLLASYHVETPLHVIENDIPSMSNDEGGISLHHKDFSTLDFFYYDASYHLSALSADEVEGASLERLSLAHATNDPNNWTTAAESKGFATPTAVNSQAKEPLISESNFVPSSTVFSPDGDGVEDVITFSYTFQKAGYILNATIYDALGRNIKILANNEIVGTKGFLAWDGTEQRGTLAKIGAYILFVEAIHESGSIKRYKKVVVLGGDR